MGRYTPISLEDYLSLRLPANPAYPEGRLFREVWEKGSEGGEVTFTYTYRRFPQYQIVVYTSLHESGMCASVGADAIRVMLYVTVNDGDSFKRLPMNPKNASGKRKGLRVFRTGGATAMLQRVLERVCVLNERAKYLQKKNAFPG